MTSLSSRILPCALGAILALGAAEARGFAGRRAPLPVRSTYGAPPVAARVVRPFLLGATTLVADVYFMQAIQLYAQRPRRATAGGWAEGDRVLAELLDFATDLDPLFVGAYRFAGSALPRETTDGKATGVLASARILRKGIRAGVPSWFIPFELGYLEMYYVGDREEAAAAFALASKMGSPGYLGGLAARLVAGRPTDLAGLEVQ